jgi:hypothetical protein
MRLLTLKLLLLLPHCLHAGCWLQLPLGLKH